MGSRLTRQKNRRRKALRTAADFGFAAFFAGGNALMLLAAKNDAYVDRGAACQAVDHRRPAGRGHEASKVSLAAA